LEAAAGGSFVEAVKRWQPRMRQVDTALHLRQAARFGAQLVIPGDPDWPTGLDDLGVHAPFALWVRGDPALLAGLDRSIAIVGARAATGYGEHVTIEVASGLVDRGFAIVSGAAFGIDGAAHRAALASGGTTIAFLAGGVDRFYPSAHESLLTRIVERGAVVAEVPCGTAPTKWRFLQRNRMIAAASRATAVVEAGWRSGSLNTAGHAAQLGRPLGAVPGPVTSSTSAGCHRLIRDYGAVCVTTAQEMAELVDPPGAPTLFAGDPSPERTRVLDALTRTGRDLTRIAAISGMSVDAVRAELGMLELDGLAIDGPAGWRRGG
jgi:DNA processing protein